MKIFENLIALSSINNGIKQHRTREQSKLIPSKLQNQYEKAELNIKNTSL